jgi:TonB family protein
MVMTLLGSSYPYRSLLVITCLLTLRVEPALADLRLESQPPGHVTKAEGNVLGPDVNSGRTEPRDFTGAWVLVEPQTSESVASGTRQILILRKEAFSPYATKPSSFTVDHGPWSPRSHERWLRDATGIYLLDYEPFHLTPLTDTVRGSGGIRDWKIQLGDTHYVARVNPDLDTLLLDPVKAPGSRQTFVRYYEYQVPTWTLRKQPMAKVDMRPAAKNEDWTDTVAVAPKPIRRVIPAYPSFAHQAGITGVVQADVLVDKEGQVQHIKLTRSVLGLEDAAKNAARQWTFQPAEVAGRPVRSWVTLIFTFSLP